MILRDGLDVTDDIMSKYGNLTRQPIAPVNKELHTINCDQVAWLGGALERYAKVMSVTQDFPRASYVSESAKTATILEIMDHLHLYFEDESARHNMAVNLHNRPIAADLRLGDDKPTRESGNAE